MPAGHAAHRGCGGEAQAVRAPLWPGLLKVWQGPTTCWLVVGVAGEAVLN